jgi:hypothetical protein
LLDQHGSQVLLGNVLMIPLNQSMLYVRPVYVTATSNPLPQLKYVIAVLGQKVGFETSLDAALSDVLGVSVSGTGTSVAPTSGTGPVSSGSETQAAADLKEATQDYTAAQSALQAGGTSALGNYQTDINAMDQELQAAQSLLATTGTTVPTTTATTKPSTSAGSSSSKKSKSSSKSSTTSTSSSALRSTRTSKADSVHKA